MRSNTRNNVVTHDVKRAITSIDAGWKFNKADVPDAVRPDYNDSAWQDVDLPHDFTITGPFDKLNGQSNGYLPRGIGWYRKHLPLANDLAGQRIHIEFEGSFRKTTVWINGEKAGYHHYGYTGFVYDITPYTRLGVENIITVKIDNPDWRAAGIAPAPDGGFPGILMDPAKEGWWYEGCGIYRHVWLSITSPLHVADWGTFVTTPRISRAEACVRVKTTIHNSSDTEQPCMLETMIVDGTGVMIAEVASEGLVRADAEIDFVQETRVKNPKLWLPDSPNLYVAHTNVKSAGNVVDTYASRFGLRWFEFTADKGFFLNGEHLHLRGMCNHHDFGGLGVALPDRANEKTIEVMKGMGCNLFRSAHNDPAPSLVEACDRLGMLLWAETRYLDEAEFPVPPLRDMIRRNRNAPSIICWSLANTAGSPDGKQTGFLKILNDVAHEEDPTRPTAFGCEGNTDANANGFAFVTDIMGYNGGGMRIDDRDHQLYPARKMFISEFSSGRGARGIYKKIPAAHPIMAVAGDGRIFQLAGQYCSIYDLCRQHEKEWSHIVQRPHLAGGAMWSGIEYWGETTGWPIVTSQFGVLDLCRFPKDAYYYYLQEWTKPPMVHIFPHWNHEGREGQMIDVWCYTNCEEVELVLNDRSLGVKPRQALTHIAWQVPYERGVLVAKGICRGKIASLHEVKTASAPAALRLSADRARIKADGRDVSFITVTILDVTGYPVPTAGNRISVRVEGAGKLLGLGAGDPGSHENPKSNTMPAFNGLLLAVVQSTKEIGEIVLMAESTGLKPARLALTTISHDIKSL